MTSFCRNCGNPILVMIQRNTGFCCQRCADIFGALHPGKSITTAGGWCLPSTIGSDDGRSPVG